ncbi:Acetyl-Coenzyme A acyltransferase 2 (mitochondrial 3-oxoacyl-Coenzyme A thiolase), isoform CRA_a [Oopsacas minuta]|uniref:Acetyl-Coenzyme A acyltransferase 2 (Mitochondrial 3-oxoacyl-Coenzyme A thiolase), isoform CRA_a n=1 Tax=Oopsacas minuta TaxID=111878 RepID=A0AAV7K030_9METZ|nr:Acetyl-Coenzyme A acyltransferase 2 (mitochondrial 3-oxoacyl-Coenzyme A thiolase), isoform CRA_a [Oopsacas minuta]
MALFRGVFIVAAKRTPFGTFGGKLKNTTATQLAIAASKATILAGKIPPEHIDSVVMGNVIQSSSDGIYVARHVGLHSGAPISSIALTVNRLCGSGFQSIVTAAEAIALGNSQIVLTGGTENMSMAPLASYDARWGTRLGIDLKFEDTLWAGLSDTYCNLPMAITAENLAEKYDISREDCDNYALQTQNRWNEANKDGRFDEEICSIQVKGKKGKEDFKTDEHPKITTIEQLAKLKPVFKKNGVVTAGNASVSLLIFLRTFNYKYYSNICIRKFRN